MPSPAKDTIYIDIDDEITAVIEKVHNSPSKVLALVLPKRATVFQSVVNMKLLKRTADQAKKNVVLITSEASLMPLAGAVGMHVAKTLQSKPTIPAAPAASDALVSVDEADVEELDDTPLDSTASVGTLAGLPDEETIEVDNDDEEDSTGPAAAAAAGAAKPKTPLNKKLKVPNFEQFRTRLFLGIGIAVALIVFWIFATFVWPKATVTIKTDTTDVTSNVAITTSPSITDVDADKKRVPGILKEYKKTDSQKAPATGQKDVGTKASGKVTFTTQTNCASPVNPISAGTSVSSGNFAFVTGEAAAFSPTGFNGGKCTWSTGATDVTAQNAGDSYNLSARDYAVSGRVDVAGKGTAMSGGTSKVIKVVSQQDIDNLKQKIIDGINGSANQELVGQLKTDGYFPLTDTFATKDPVVVPSPAADSEADEVSVNVTITFTMVGANEDGVKQILEADIKQHIDATKQNILDNGLAAATIRIDNKDAKGNVSFTLQTIAKAGVEQNEADIKQAIAGKKKGEVQTILQSRPGVKEVQIQTSPFWVYKVPKKDSKITLVFEQQGNTGNNGH